MIEEDTSEEIADQLQPYGLVRVSQVGDSGGWYAKCELRLSGVRGSVESEFGHNSMRDSMLELRDRVLKSCGVETAVPRLVVDND